MKEEMEVAVNQSVFFALMIVFVSVIFISGKWYLSYRKDKREAEAEKRKQTDGRAPDEMVVVLINKIVTITYSVL